MDKIKTIPVVDLVFSYAPAAKQNDQKIIISWGKRTAKTVQPTYQEYTGIPQYSQNNSSVKKLICLLISNILF